jgi:uncharacterized damage-inducible protein DinB
MSRFVWAAIVGSLLLSPAFGQTQTASKQTFGPSEALLRAWNEIGRKLIAMAEDFPENKYEFKPTPAERSFAEQLVHMAGSNDFFIDVANGKKAKDDESRAHYKTKADIVAYVKKSFADGAAVIKQKGDAGMLQMATDNESGNTVPLQALAYDLIEHCGEHYGQLVVYYRVAGLVPPESRPKK